MLARIDLEHEWEIKCLINPEAFYVIVKEIIKD